MSEEFENPPVEQETQEVPEFSEPQKPKSKRGVMTDVKLANLAKAREARKKNLEAKKTRYPKDKRSALEKKIQEQEELEERIAAEAEKKAMELIERKKQEEELREYRLWKKQQEEAARNEEAESRFRKARKRKPQQKRSLPRRRRPRKAKTKIQMGTVFQKNKANRRSLCGLRGQKRRNRRCHPRLMQILIG